MRQVVGGRVVDAQAASASQMGRFESVTLATPAPDTAAVATRAREAERDRVSTIYDLTGRLNLERGFAEDLVKRGVSVDESRRLILDQVAAKSDETRTFGHVSAPLGARDERITRRDAVANALLHRYSLGNAGVNTRGLSRDEVATRALHSTSDFPEILSAVTNKTLRQTYDAYPKAGESLNAAALVWSKAPVIVGAHDTGPLIRSKDGFRLAIPTEAAGRGLRGSRITAGEWERRRGLRLRFVYRRRGPCLLVAEGRLNSHSLGVASRSKTGRGRTTVPIFLLVPHVKLPRRLDLDRDAERALDRVPGLFVANWVEQRVSR